MTIDYDATVRESGVAASGPLSTFVDRLAERVGGRANAKAVFADPVERGGVTVIPVAKVRYAFGGGAGSGGEEDEDKSDQGQGAGGGGMVSARPLGFIEIRDGQAEFRPLPQVNSPVPVILGSALAAWVVLRGLRALFK